MLRALFSDENKLVHLEFVFDVMSFAQQLMRASARFDFPTVPHSLEFALQEKTQEARVVTTAEPPYTITYVNDAWSHLCGYSLDEARGKTLRMIQGELTDKTTTQRVMDDVRACRSTCALLTNYPRGSQPFLNFLRVYPLFEGGVVTHFLGVLEDSGQQPSSSDRSSEPSSSDEACAPAADESPPLATTEASSPESTAGLAASVVNAQPGGDGDTSVSVSEHTLPEAMPLCYLPADDSLLLLGLSDGSASNPTARPAQ